MKSFVRLITEVGFFVEEIMKKSNKLRNFFTELLLLFTELMVLLHYKKKK